MKDNRPLIEPTVDHSGSHVKWNVTSLSPVGPIIPISQSVERHGVVLVYWLSSNSGNNNNSNNTFHIYLAPNSSSEIQVSGMSLFPRGDDCPFYVCKMFNIELQLTISIVIDDHKVSSLPF